MSRFETRIAEPELRPARAHSGISLNSARLLFIRAHEVGFRARGFSSRTAAPVLRLQVGGGADVAQSEPGVRFRIPQRKLFLQFRGFEQIGYGHLEYGDQPVSQFRPEPSRAL